MLSEIGYRAQACTKFLITEQKLIDDEHRMYPEHVELLPWVLTNLPVDFPANTVPPLMEQAYSTFYEYIQTIVYYLQNHDVQNMRR